LGDQIKKNELVGRSNNQKRYEKCVYNLNCKSKGKKNKGQTKKNWEEISSSLSIGI
jgi:hypothetical protein